MRIYERNAVANAWEQVGADIDGEAALDYSGWSVSFRLTAAPSPLAPLERRNGNDSGHVRIYQRNAVTNAWEQVGADIDGEAAGDGSGGGVSLSADGSTVAIGAQYNGGNGSDSGHVRIYQRNTATNVWEQVGADIDGEAAGDYSGESVSLSAMAAPSPLLPTRTTAMAVIRAMCASMRSIRRYRPGKGTS